MIELARARGVYDALHVEDLLATLARADHAVDLVLAADVFIYVGALAAVFAATARALTAGGRFAFSVERAAPEAAGVHLQATSRYAHSDAYLRDLAAHHGFTVHAARDTVIRTDHRTAIPGVLYLLTAGAA
jgi:predicted TPR repeat methyltransferase